MPLLATLLLAAPAQAASVKGKWKGTVHSGTITFPVKMTIKRTKVGAKLRWHATAPSGQVGTALLRRG